MLCVLVVTAPQDIPDNSDIYFWLLLSSDVHDTRRSTPSLGLNALAGSSLIAAQPLQSLILPAKAPTLTSASARQDGLNGQRL